MDRPLSDRERAVLDALLAGSPDAREFRSQAEDVRVVGTCGCGCPSVDFFNDPGAGLSTLVDAGLDGTDDGLFLYALGDRLGGIEYVSSSDEMASELPDPLDLIIR